MRNFDEAMNDAEAYVARCPEVSLGWLDASVLMMWEIGKRRREHARVRRAVERLLEGVSIGNSLASTIDNEVRAVGNKRLAHFIDPHSRLVARTAKVLHHSHDLAHSKSRRKVRSAETHAIEI